MLWWWWTGCYVGVDQNVTIDEPIDRIVVDVTAGDLTILGAPGPVHIEGAFAGPGPGPITGEVIGTELVVSFECNLCGGELTITAPPQTALDVVLGAGDLDVEEMTGELVASLIGGTASVVRHGAGSVAVTVDAGAFDASFVDVPSRLLATVSTSGGIDVALPAGPYALDLDANGLLTVDEAILDDPNSPNEVVLTASSGSIRVSAAPPAPPPLPP